MAALFFACVLTRWLGCHIQLPVLNIEFVKLPIATARCHEVAVFSAFDDLARLQNQDEVRVRDRFLRFEVLRRR